MANFTLFQDILDKGSSLGFQAARTTESRQWYRNQAEQIRRVDQRSLLNQKDRITSRAFVGQMFIFSYDPKTKQDLPYYDRLPLIFPFKVVSGGMYGINMHYLPPVYRAKLMDSLYGISSDKRYDENTKLNMTYAILDRAARFRYFRPCVKHYLNTHIRSQLVKINPQEWDMALFLPLERFQKASKQRVFKESVKQIQR